MTALKGKFYNTEEDLDDLQSKHRQCVSHLKELVDQAEDLVRKETAGKQDKANFEGRLESLIRERREIITHMNNLADAYEKYVKEMISERADIVKANKRHMKVLASSILFTQLAKRRAQRLRLGLKAIKEVSERGERVKRCVIELARLKDAFKEKMLGLAFRRWRRGELKWTKEREVNEVLLEKEHKKRQRAKYFSLWHKIFREVSEKRDRQIEGADRIRQLRAQQQTKDVRTTFSRWYRWTILKNHRDLYLKKLVQALIKKKKEKAFVKWFTLTKETGYEAQVRALSNLNAEQKFKRQMFARFRHNLHLAEDSKVTEAQVFLDNRQTQKQKNRFIKASTILFMLLDKKRNDAAEEEVFESLRFNSIREKKGRANAQLAKEASDMEDLKQSIRDTSVNQTEWRKKANLMASNVTLRRRLRYYLERWLSVIPMQANAAITLKRVLSRFAVNKLTAALCLWRRHSYEGRVGHEKERIANYNTNVNDTEINIRELENEIEMQENHMKKYSLSKLERVVHIIARRLMHKAILQWKNSAMLLKDIEQGGRKLNKIVRRKLLRMAISNCKEQHEMIKKEEGDKNKIESVKSFRERNIQRIVFKGFTNQIRFIRSIKNTLRKLFRDKENNKIRRYLKQWLENIHNDNGKQIELNNKEAIEHITNMQEDIEISEKSKKYLNDDIEELEKKENKKSATAIFKHFLLNHKQRMLEALNTWRNKTSRAKTIIAALTRYLTKKTHNSCRLAFLHWQAGAHHKAIGSIDKKLEEHVVRHNTFKRLSTVKLDETEGELKQLKNSFNEVFSQIAIDEKRVKDATGVMDKLQRQYKRTPNDHNCLLAWVDMVRRERDLQGQAKKITQMYAGKHIYAKLKLAAQESKARAETEKKLRRALNNIAKCWMRKGFVSMRMGSKLKAKEELNNVMQEQQTIIDKVNTELNGIRELSRCTYEKELKRKYLMKIFIGWQLQSRFQRLLRKKTEQLNDTLRLIRVGGSFGRWHEDFNYIKNTSDKSNRAEKHYTKFILKKTLKGWHNIYKRRINLPKALERLSKRQCINNIGYCLTRLLSFINQKNQNNADIKEIATSRLTSLVVKAFTQKMANTLHRLIKNASEQTLNKELLRRMLIKRISSIRLAVFNRWRAKTEECNIVDRVETKGNTANLVKRLIRRQDSIRKVLVDTGLEGVHEANSPFRIKPVRADTEAESTFKNYVFSAGISSREISPVEEKKILLRSISRESPSSISWSLERRQMLEGREDSLKKMILLWTRKTDNTERMGRHVDAWKKWLKLRKDVNRASEFVLKRLVHGEKAWAFDKLRNLRRAGIKICKEAPRSQLLKQLMENDNKLKKLESENESLKEQLNSTMQTNEKLSSSYNSGKTLAAAVIKHLVNKPACKAFTEWKLMTQRAQNADLESLLREKLACLEKLAKIRDRLAIQNSNLLDENEQLRQTSLDGIEIANVVQKITQEREQLSEDLKDRSLIVKKLMNENTYLQSKVSTAKEEAGNLIRLSREYTFS